MVGVGGSGPDNPSVLFFDLPPAKYPSLVWPKPRSKPRPSTAHKRQRVISARPKGGLARLQSRFGGPRKGEEGRRRLRCPGSPLPRDHASGRAKHLLSFRRGGQAQKRSALCRLATRLRPLMGSNHRPLLVRGNGGWDTLGGRGARRRRRQMQMRSGGRKLRRSSRRC